VVGRVALGVAIGQLGILAVDLDPECHRRDLTVALEGYSLVAIYPVRR
jgi:hypothetical protein